MKKSLLRIISVLLLLGILTACTPKEETNPTVPSDTTVDSDVVRDMFDVTSMPTQEVAPTEETLQPDEVAPEPPAELDDAIPKNSSFSVHFIDVGQADAALVEWDGQYMLIDGGNKADSSVIYSILKKA